MDEDDALKVALDHAWSWFALHAGQRMQLMNYMLLSVSFVLAAYGATFNAEQPVAAGGIASLGVIIVLGFWRLDIRTKELLEEARPALIGAEERLSAITYINVRIAGQTASDHRLARYSKVIRSIALVSAAALLVAAVYAFINA